MKTTTTTPTPATKLDVTALCARAIELHLKKGAIDDELKALKDQLIGVAAKDKKNQAETDAGGRSWIHGDDQGRSVRVSFPIATYPAVSSTDKQLTEAVRELAGDDLKTLFSKETIYAPCKQFELRAHEKLGRVNASTLLDLLRKDSSPKVSFVVKGGQ